MRTLQVLCALCIVVLYSSCTYQEDSVAFFIDNQLNTDLIIHRSQDETTTSGNVIEHGVPLDLTSSEAYERYILRLTQLEVTKFECTFTNYQGLIENGRIYLDNILLGEFDADITALTIDDSFLLESISDLFFEKTKLDFYFIGHSNTSHALNVNVNIEMKGTFVH